MDEPRIDYRWRKIRRAVLASLFGLLFVAGLAELTLRFLLFGSSTLAHRLGEGWRHAEWYADPRGEDEYWKLQYLFLDPSARTDVPRPDSVCGWTGGVDSDTHEPLVATDLRGRRPVLLYGDSYAQCTTTSSHCFPALLEQSELADRFCMINYGVGGYGLDQIDLFLRQTIDRWKDLDPIVVVSFFVDDDFHRDTLTFRGWPKPRFSIDGDRLVQSGPPILPAERFLEENPVGIRSYLYRFLVFRLGVLPESWRTRLRRSFEHHEEQVALGRKILEDIHAELESRGLKHFFLAFHGWDSLQPSPSSQWADDLATDTAARLGVPLIGTRPFLLAATGGNLALAGERFFGGRGNRFGHYNEIGNWIAFEAMRQGLEGRFDSPDTSRVAGFLDRYPLASSKPDGDRTVDTTFLGSVARVLFLGNSGIARSSTEPYRPFDSASIQDYLIVRPGEGGPTRIRIAIPERALHLRGKATAVARGKNSVPEGALSLSVVVDGKLTLSSKPPAFPGWIDLDVDVAEAKELELVAEKSKSSASDEWIHIAKPRFAWKP